MSPDMRAHLFLNAGLLGQLLADLPDAGGMHGTTRLLSRKQPVRGFAPTPVSPQQRQQFRREHNLARSLALSLSHQNHHPLAIDVRDLEVEHFGATQPGRIEGRQQSPMLEILRGVQHGGNFFAAQDRRKFSPDFGFGDPLDEPALFQGLRIEEFERGVTYLKSGPSNGSDPAPNGLVTG